MSAKVVAPFEGGKGPMLVALMLGAAGLVGTAIGGLSDPRRTLFSYLTAMAFWLGISLGALFLVAIFHASNAKWPVVVGGCWNGWPNAARSSLRFSCQSSLG